ncbi:MAG: CoA pyrophosphatase [Chloroflexi bacterium]|nr:CoA pyrophosphatase [Chloroflexota bacterium]
MKEHLTQALSLRRRRTIIDPSRIKAAVLVPVYSFDNQYHLLLTRRTDTVREHKGQISFPGGAYEPGDGSLLETALRECAEEIGILAGDTEVVGQLDDELSQTSNYVISSYVAFIPWPYELKINRGETEEVIEAPVSALLNGDCLRIETQFVKAQPLTAYYYQYRDVVIWGATARILKQFLDAFAEAQALS